MLLKNKFVYLSLISPLIFYPAYLAIVILGDTFAGDAAVFDIVSQGSKRNLIKTILSDYLASLTPAILISVVVAAFILVFMKYKRNYPSLLYTLAMAAASGSIFGMILSGDVIIAIIFMLSALVSSSALHTTLSKAHQVHQKAKK